MPHRVADFLRSSTGNFSIKSSIRQQQTQQDGVQQRRVTARRSSSTESSEDEAIPYHRMYSADSFPMIPARPQPLKEKKEKKEKAEKKDNKHALHRLSLPFGRSKEQHENPHASLDWKIESPPIIFFGDAESSSGALVSGQMFLDVKDENLEIASFGATLQIRVHQKRPFAAHCPDCAEQYTELKRWTFLTHPTTLRRGRHQFPFSILLEGHLPASMDTPLVNISYEFKAEVQLPATARLNPKVSNIPIRLERLFDVKRSLPTADTPHHSVRVFPPTNIKAGAHYDQIIHPMGANHAVQLRLDGLTSVNAQSKTIEYWKLKKVTWRLEETVKTIAPACKKHTPVATNPDGTPAANAGKGTPRTETRNLGEKHIYEGWKSDYSATDGHVEFEFDYGIASSLLAAAAHSSSSRSGGALPAGAHGYACDTRSRDGTEVSHALMIEMVVSKEWAPLGKPHLATQTGTGRILRMHYHVLLTDCPGLGVSWDNEAPPVYQDVPPSPPAYPDDKCPIDYESLEPLDATFRQGNRSPEPALGFQWETNPVEDSQAVASP
jgi:arrestin-related trafficking adapter 1